MKKALCIMLAVMMVFSTACGSRARRAERRVAELEEELEELQDLANLQKTEEPSKEEASKEEALKEEATKEESTEEATESAEEDEADKEADEENDDKDDGDKKSSLADGLIRDEIKEAIDSYEDFVDEYCEFLKNYDPSDLSSLTGYADLMSREVEMSKEFNDIEDMDLTDAEALYYSEVSLRCSEKMLKAMQ